MRSEIQKELADAFDSDLADAVKAFTGSYVIEGDWDPVTETGNDSLVEYTGRGILDNYNLNCIDGVNILNSDALLIALASEVTGKPDIDHKITIDGVSYKVISVQVDPVGAHYDIQLRRS
ncbi:glutamate 5-kinase [Providencia stuartii]|uniref:glutamate 5-kinase n=1 Tax=Providencia stuartii TaxID=588 RepID=UPI000DE69A5A|nr:glutamate 5-kinase [Providencia stuartii]MDT1068342.1 glutamate 5-kinase [Providencia stuartii]SST04545.1 glutamate 5-kinase [Acinetobacter baumannii]